MEKAMRACQDWKLISLLGQKAITGRVIFQFSSLPILSLQPAAGDSRLIRHTGDIKVRGLVWLRACS